MRLHPDSPDYTPVIQAGTFFAEELTELKRGDILVKGNHNWLPGTCFTEGGAGMGHAVIVLENCSGENTLDLLMHTWVFESNSRDVPDAWQVRKVKAFVNSGNENDMNLSFGNEYKGNRYRLRLNLTEKQKDSIIGFILREDERSSCWHTMKDYRKRKSGSPATTDKKAWYCTLLIWQAFYEVAGVDLDANRGLIVYPNDLIDSPWFDGRVDGQVKRIRF